MSTCPSWCEMDKCHGDHISEEENWPVVRVRPYPLDEVVNLSVRPVWCEMDGLAPQVAAHFDTPGTGFEFYLTPLEARALAHHLVSVADAVDLDLPVPTVASESQAEELMREMAELRVEHMALTAQVEAILAAEKR